MDYTEKSNVSPSIQTPPLKPQSWLWQSIVITILCCLPFGIAGIVNAAKVDPRYYAGDYEGAARAAKSAKMWILIGVIFGIIIYIIYGISLFNMMKSGDFPSNFPMMGKGATTY